jgi:hypothetical protein
MPLFTASYGIKFNDSTYACYLFTGWHLCIKCSRRRARTLLGLGYYIFIYSPIKGPQRAWVHLKQIKHDKTVQISQFAHVHTHGIITCHRHVYIHRVC